MNKRTFRAETPLQALLVEQALLLAKQLEAAADAAPDGQVLARVEALAVPAGRALTRTAVEAALQAQADAAEKRGAGPHLSLRAAPLAQGPRRTQRPDRRRRRPAPTPLRRLSPLRPEPLPAGRPPRHRRPGQPARPQAADAGRGQLVLRRQRPPARRVLRPAHL